MRALVMGGTGLVGAALLEELSRDPAYTRITSIARRAHPAPPRVDVRVVDPAAIRPLDCDIAFCALGTTIRAAGSQDAFRAVDHALVLRFARAALAGGARSFHVVSSMGASASSRIFYNRVKGEMERDVRTLGLESTCFYRPSLLLGERAQTRPGERFGALVTRALAPVIPARYRGIPATTVARAMARHARAAHTGAHIHMSDELPRLAED